ncbi:MAG: Crp/Fnr family transcriptional regulator, partial [Spirochaetia bacterium]|nr:Crp/Fnr family transcriptional regulator [Spirochaetia bacterium]
ALPAELQSNVYKTDVNILEGLGHRLARLLQTNLAELYQLQSGIDDSLETLTHGEYSFLEKFHLLADAMDSGIAGMGPAEIMTVLRYLHQSVTTFGQQYGALQGMPYTKVSPSFAKIKEIITKNPAAEEKKESASDSPVLAGVDFESVKRELAGSASKIMSFVTLPAEEARKMLADLKTLKGMDNPLDSSGDQRRFRRNVARAYWQVYDKAYFKYRENKGNVPLPIRLMLFYGFFDEEFLTNDQLAQLHQLADSTRAKKEYPVVYGIDWVGLVGEKKEPPSLDELGLTMFEKLKNEHKDKGWKRESDVPEEYDNNTSRSKYELTNYLESNVRLTSGSMATAFPILTKFQITLPLDKCFVTMKKVSDALDRLLSIDFSAFHREILINDEEKGILKEFVQQQVIPYFILVPSIGTKVMMWQDLAGRSKTSRGRISIPIFATGDLFTMILEAVAAFRWELTKSIAGPDWNNVSVPSLTADYTDYAQFFKKNKDLSPEVKEKLAAEFKRLRSDRDRFTADYCTWVKFESEGSLRLNRVVRGIMYRHVPFSKDIRDKLATQPAYAEMHNRFTNIRNRKLKEMEVKYRKYGETMPDILRKNVEFHKV